MSLEPRITTTAFDELHQRGQYHGPKPTVLLILDGWGIGPDYAGNAIKRAQTPNLDTYWLNFPHGQLGASGQSVGLPEGEDGNTETGHLNIGAGTIIYQDLPRIDAAIADKTFFKIGAFRRACKHVKECTSKLHIMGLIGEGGVHSSFDHLLALLELAKQEQVSQVYVHAFTDGRDSPPTSGVENVKKLLNFMQKQQVGKLASLMGRYYAMDRDQRWDRIEKAYITLTQGSGTAIEDPVHFLQDQYQQKITDEFITPQSIAVEGRSITVDENDAVIFFNYRVDRPRELTRAFVMADFETQGALTSQAFDPYSHQSNDETVTFKRQKKVNNLYFVTMTRYEKNLPADVAFLPQIIDNPLPKVFSDYGLRQLRVAETEKERFVTYYLNGQTNQPYPGEDRIIIPSKGKRSYDEVPAMSTPEMTQAILQAVQENTYDTIICNFANADMVGHTGNLEATIEACEVIDQELGKIVDAVYQKNGVVLVTADHGNAEELINLKTGQPDTEHSTFPVPFLIIGPQFAANPIQLPEGILADVAPTMLSVMGLNRPDSMTGRALI